MLLARVIVMPKPVVNDPEGLAIRHGLHMLGFDSVEQVRAGKHLEIRLDDDDLEQARRAVDEMCRRLLANGVIEDYRFDLAQVPEMSTA